MLIQKEPSLAAVITKAVCHQRYPEMTSNWRMFACEVTLEIDPVFDLRVIFPFLAEVTPIPFPLGASPALH